ncbi:hypothetical protein NAI45_10450, partial [Francisella tularensis subsp. holarctica]|nr:hypothetical protein [Francisella tularensis subsp. holarctica]
EFPKLQEIELDNHRDHDVNFYLVVDTYVFDHYKDELYVISTKLFSDTSKSQLEAKVNQRIDDLKNINLAYEKIELEIAERQIKT